MGSCTVGGLCNEQSQDLFNLELHTPAENKLWRAFPMIQPGNINWRFDYSNVDTRDRFAILSASQYNNIAYDLDSSYRTIECVPKGECDFDFNITADSRVETYAVKKNGIQLDDSQELQDEFSWRMLIMTPFGQNCFPKDEKFVYQGRSLSGGAIAGIVVGCLVALSVLIGLIMVCLVNRNEGSQNHHDEEDPLNENLLSEANPPMILYS